MGNSRHLQHARAAAVAKLLCRPGQDLGFLGFRGTKKSQGVTLEGLFTAPRRASNTPFADYYGSRSAKQNLAITGTVEPKLDWASAGAPKDGLGSVNL
jgi:hypothetical protein